MLIRPESHIRMVINFGHHFRKFFLIELHIPPCYRFCIFSDINIVVVCENESVNIFASSFQDEKHFAFTKGVEHARIHLYFIFEEKIMWHINGILILKVNYLNFWLRGFVNNYNLLWAKHAKLLYFWGVVNIEHFISLGGNVNDWRVVHTNQDKGIVEGARDMTDLSIKMVRWEGFRLSFEHWYF